jgi:E3 ubiquitin-protein ligase NEDD4-like
MVQYTCQRVEEEPAELIEARKAASQDTPMSVESPEMMFRKKRFHFHRELRMNVPTQTTAFELTLTRANLWEDTIAKVVT